MRPEPESLKHSLYKQQLPLNSNDIFLPPGPCGILASLQCRFSEVSETICHLWVIRSPKVYLLLPWRGWGGANEEKGIFISYRPNPSLWTGFDKMTYPDRVMLEAHRLASRYRKVLRISFSEMISSEMMLACWPVVSVHESSVLVSCHCNPVLCPETKHNTLESS